MNFTKKYSKGFSLVEMSVVLVSIGIIIVAIIGNNKFVNNTKINKIISNVDQFAGAIEKFEKEYGSLPGDIANVTALGADNSSRGNGNGVIDSASEALNVWYHLSLSGLIEGDYDGTSALVPGTGTPMADIEGAGYKVKVASTIVARNVPEQAIAIEIAGYGTTDNLPIITAEDAKSIDEKVDDGNPNTGVILAEGDGNCINGSEYNVSEETASCRLIFVIRNIKNVDIGSPTGACTQLGLVRVLASPSEKCTEGYEGKIVQTCSIDENNVGIWEITDRVCEEVRCSNGGSYGDTRKYACINGMNGNGIVQRCNENGIWVEESNDCTIDEYQPCDTDSETRAMACGFGEVGYIIQTCTNNKWQTTSNQCNPVQCSGQDIGNVRNSSINCGTNYTGNVNEVCTIDGQWQVTSIGSTCVPNYVGMGACTDGDTMDLSCHSGKSGVHKLICSAGEWTTLIDNCKPIRCDGKHPVGSYRVKDGVKCPNGSSGTVYEYCNASGNWQPSNNHCVSGVCEATDDLAGNAFWGVTTAGNIATSTNCNAGYEVTGSTQRQCNADGTWGAVITPCTRITCPAIPSANYNGTITTDDDATYPVTFAGENDVQALNCQGSGIGYSAPPGYPVANCNLNGTWSNERIGCTKVCSVTGTVMGRPVCPDGDIADNSGNWGCARMIQEGGCDINNIDDVMFYAGDVPGTSEDFFVRRCDLSQDWDPVDGRCEGSDGTTVTRTNYQWKDSATNSGTVHMVWGTPVTNINTTDGPGNTAILYADASGVHGAAEGCRNLPGVGWYLPAIAELDVMYSHLIGTDDTEHPLPLVGDNADLNNSGTTGPLRSSYSVANDWYWSSTELSNSGAWTERLSDGRRFGFTKTDLNSNGRNNYVRCARRVDSVVNTIMGRPECPSGDLSTPRNSGCGRLFGSDPTDIDHVMFYTGDLPGTTTDIFVRRCDLGQDWDIIDGRCEASDGTTTTVTTYQWKNVNTDSITPNISSGVSLADANAKDGPGNTTILTSAPYTPGTHPAAEACNNIPGGGWYLPSISELSVIYAYVVEPYHNYHPIPTVNDANDGNYPITINTVRSGPLGPTFTGGIATNPPYNPGDFYWSSSESLAGGWAQRFTNGDQTVYGRTTTISSNSRFLVRCTRR
ncbi:MAG: hypothetical protein PQ612_10610 [Rickettsiales bacterium]|nr:hypothetical protein [Pseudomonadota bacterium]MDA0966898.1 hypothetical protein [Pseudomonadota bacterium]MDG4544451.1 hypothetical protein [Rickettsiales bacterium]MDG4546602.1 hypothetical protein [Rickettsiales bacterium]MDG4548727.1 hypothetical protein [Rickettsiales bacterium]